MHTLVRYVSCYNVTLMLCVSFSMSMAPTSRKIFGAFIQSRLRVSNGRQGQGLSSLTSFIHQNRGSIDPTSPAALYLHPDNNENTKNTIMPSETDNLSRVSNGVNHAQHQDDAHLYQPTFKKGDTIQVEIVSFGPLGASVDVIAHNSHDPSDCISSDEPALGRGLILQREINYFREKRGGLDVVRYETLPAYVENVREQQFKENGDVEIRLDVCLRPIGGKAKALELGDIILQRIKEENGILNVGDKSSPEDISQYFPGASKIAFKRALSDLYKRGLVQPGPHSISLM